MLIHIILILLTFSCQYSIGSFFSLPIDPTQDELGGKVGDSLTGNLRPKNDNNIVNSSRDTANDSNTIIPGAFGYTWAWNSQKTNLKTTFFVATTLQNNDNEYSKTEHNMALSLGSVDNLNVTDKLNKSLDTSSFKYTIKPTKIIIKQSLLSDLYERYMITFCIRNEILVDQARYPIDLEEQDLSLMMDVQNPRNYINQHTGPKGIFDKVTKVVYHNGWYTEKILRYDKGKKPTIHSTWQHKTYIFCTSSAVALFLYATYFL